MATQYPGLTQEESAQVDAMAKRAESPNINYAGMMASGDPVMGNLGSQLQAQQTRVRGGQLNALTNALNARTARRETAANRSALQKASQAYATGREDLGYERGLTATNLAHERGLTATEDKQAHELEKERIKRLGKLTDTEKLVAAQNKTDLTQRYGLYLKNLRSPQQISSEQAKNFTKKSSKYRAMDRAINTFKPEFVRGTKWQGNFDRWLSANAGFLANDKQRELAAWWREYGKEITLNERHEAFGSAFTATEKEEWNKVDVTPGMKSEDLLEALNNRRDVMKSVLERQTRGMSRASRSPQLVREYLGPDLFDEFEQGEGGEIVSGAPTFEEFLREQGEGEGESGAEISDEEAAMDAEIARLKEVLKKK